MDLMLEDKVAMISGGSKGIGLNIARDLAADGCHVAISGRTQADLDEAVKNIGAQERVGLFFPAQK